MDLLTLASRHRDWLALRQTTVAENIANANTPGFKAREVQPFNDLLTSIGRRTAMTASHPRHIVSGDTGRVASTAQPEEQQAITHSGNSVNVEDELQTAGSVKREYALNVSVTRTIERMMTMSLRG